MWMMEMKKKRVEDERVSIAVGGCGLMLMLNCYSYGIAC